MQIRIAGTVNDSIVDGIGLRYTIFTQGCPHVCPGCHNPKTHNIYGGYSVDTSEIINQIKKNPLLDGITLSGGEPFLQPIACRELAEAAKNAGLNVWAYTGYIYEYLKTPEQLDLLRYIDVLVDGPFIQDQKSLELRFRGSKNQRLIDVKRSLEEGHVVEWDSR